MCRSRGPGALRGALGRGAKKRHVVSNSHLSWKIFRSILLLSVVGTSKLYESVLANRLSRLLDGRDRRGEHLLSQFQGGFRRGRSCQHQSWVSELIKTNARRGKKTYVAFLDVREAYPTCRRAAMLERLYAKLAARRIFVRSSSQP